MSRHPHAVVMGDLNLVRCFGIARIPFVPVATTKSTLVLNSRGAMPGVVIPDPMTDSNAAKASLIALAGDRNVRPILFFSNDQQALMVSRHRDELNAHFRFVIADPDVVETATDKNAFADFARKFDLPVPTTYKGSDVRSGSVSGEIRFPCVVKPVTRFYWRVDGNDPFEKVRTVENMKELDAVLSHLSPDADFVLQEYIPGTDDLVYSYHALYDNNGACRASFCGKKVRSYPNHNGYSASVCLVDNPELVRLGRAIMERTGIRGVIKIDFKRDPRNGKFYLLELNPRFNMWHYLGAVSGINLPHLAFLNATGASSPTQSARLRRTDILWVNMRRDMKAAFEARREGRLSLASWLMSYMRPKIYDKFAWSDPMPGLHGIARFLLNRLTGILRRMRPTLP